MKIKNKQHLWDQIDKQRIKRGWSLRKLAREVEVSAAVLSMYGSGKRVLHWDILFDCVKALDFKVQIDVRFSKPKSKT